MVKYKVTQAIKGKYTEQTHGKIFTPLGMAVVILAFRHTHHPPTATALCAEEFTQAKRCAMARFPCRTEEFYT